MAAALMPRRRDRSHGRERRRDQTHHGDGDEEAWKEDGDEADESTNPSRNRSSTFCRCRCRGSDRNVRCGEGAEVDGEVKVRARKGLNDGEAYQKFARRDPAVGNNVFAQQGDHDGASAEDDRPG